MADQEPHQRQATFIPTESKYSDLFAKARHILGAGFFHFKTRTAGFSISSRIASAGTTLERATFQFGNRYHVAPAKALSERRYLVSAEISPIPSGLGISIRNLAPSWKYARTTGRTLVIDWRGSPYTATEPTKNLFALLFEPPDPIEMGVPVISDDSVNELALPQPLLGPHISTPNASGGEDQLPNGGLPLGDLRQIMQFEYDVDFPTVIPHITSLVKDHMRLPLNMSDGRMLYRSLKLQPVWASQVHQFEQSYMAGSPVVGVQIRHGNGEGKYRDHFRSREIQDFASFVESLSKKIKRYAFSRFGNDYKVFLCTDSDAAVMALKRYFPRMISRHIWRPPMGEGVDFDHAHTQPDKGLEIAANALIDMQLLSKCDAVFFGRWTSFASHIPYLFEKPGAAVFYPKQIKKLQS